MIGYPVIGITPRDLLIFINISGCGPLCFTHTVLEHAENGCFPRVDRGRARDSGTRLVCIGEILYCVEELT